MGNSGTTFVSYTEPVDRRRQSCKRPTRGSGMAGQEREPIPGLFRRSYRASARKYFLPSALIRSSNQEREPVQKSGVITNPSRYGAPIIPLLPVYAYLFNLFVCQCCWGVRSLAAQGGASSPSPDPATTASLELLRPLLAALSSLRRIVQALSRF